MEFPVHLVEYLKDVQIYFEYVHMVILNSTGFFSLSQKRNILVTQINAYVE